MIAVPTLFAVLVLAQSAPGPAIGSVRRGTVAPAFTATIDDGTTIDSSDLFVPGRYTALVFYPADFSPGAIRQFEAYQSQLTELSDLGVAVYGVSGDAVSSHRLFKQEHELSVPLISDPAGTLAARYGVPVWRERTSVRVVVGGRRKTLSRAVTFKHWTFVIGPDGTVLSLSEFFPNRGKSFQQPEDDARYVVRTVSRPLGE